MTHINICRIIGENNFEFNEVCLAGLDLALRKEKLKKITYDFSYMDKGDPARWINWISGIQQWWFFHNWIDDPEKIGKERRIEFDLTKINCFEFYSVFSCIRIMSENLDLFPVRFDLSYPSGEQFRSVLNSLGWTHPVFLSHTIFSCKEKNLNFNKIKKIPFYPPLVKANYNFFPIGGEHAKIYTVENTE